MKKLLVILLLVTACQQVPQTKPGTLPTDGQVVFSTKCLTVAPPAKAAGLKKMAMVAGGVQMLIMEGFTEQAAYGPFANLVGQDAAAFWTEVSYGKLQVSHVVAPPFKVAATATCTNWNGDALRAATNVGLDGTNQVYISSAVGSGCPFGANASPSGRSINVWGAFNGQQLAHELGHNLGLGHTARYDCQGRPFHPVNCGQLLYGDPYDVMSASFTWPSSDNLLRLGFIPGTDRLMWGRKSGNISLAPIQATSGMRQATVERADGFTYAIERRDPIGRDATVSRRWVLRMYDSFVRVLLPGEAWRDETGGLEFILSTDGTSLNVATFTPAAVTVLQPTPNPHPGFPDSTATPFVGVPCVMGKFPDGSPCSGPITFTPKSTTQVPQSTTRTPIPTGCKGTSSSLCLGGRFAVAVSWKTVDGKVGVGQALPFTWESGLFWFFTQGNAELLVKVIDARSVNGKWWVFYGSATNVEFKLTVTDTYTGVVKTYSNPQGKFASFGDTSAF